MAMRDFHRRKVNLRKTIAAELLQRGVGPEEVARLCQPTPEEIYHLEKEIRREQRAGAADTIDAEFWDVVHEKEPPTPLLFEPFIMLLIFVLLLAFSLGIFIGAR